MGAVIPKLFNNLGLLPFIDNYIPKILKKPEHKNRIAIFYTFGEDSTALSNYIDYKFENKNDLEHWNKSYVDNNVLEFANSKGFEIHNKIIGYFKLKKSSFHLFTGDFKIINIVELYMFLSFLFEFLF